MSEQTPLLIVDKLVAGYEPGMPIVNGASLSVAAREIVAVLGPNGAGKSTLMRAIAGLVSISGGSVTFAGHNVTHTPAHRLIGAGLAFTPQTENVFASLSVGDNLKLAAGILPRTLRADRIAAAYETFPDLARQRALPAGRLSGGQRQMLAIARALLVAPKALMLDEPSAGLSPKLVEIVFARLADIRQTGVAIVLVEQNTRAALALADRAYILVQGRNRHEGLARALTSDPMIAALYLGGVETGATS
jgi:branched-chain amino acid transport system ATP-binding protein